MARVCARPRPLAPAAPARAGLDLDPDAGPDSEPVSELDSDPDYDSDVDFDPDSKPTVCRSPLSCPPSPSPLPLLSSS